MKKTKQTLKKKWQHFTNDLIGKKDYFLIDTVSYSLFTNIKYFINKYARGITLDAGAGRLAFKYLITPKVKKYYSVDKDAAVDDLSLVSDLCAVPLKNNIFDIIFCLQVIEHSPSPEKIIQNLYKSLKKNGILILSAPHIFYLHGEPEDYYRFTKYGLKNLLQKNGLEVLEIKTSGSIVGLLLSFCSDIILTLTYGIPIIHRFIFFINSIFVPIISHIDETLFKDSILAVNYIAAAKKIKN